MLKLYHSPGKISLAAGIALEEAGLDYEPVLVDFASGEQTGAGYARINPKGRVPALATDQGILTETGAILDYIGAVAPEAGLIPADPYQAGRMREMMYYFASTMHVNHAHLLRGSRWADHESSWADMKQKVPQTMAASCAYVEANAALSPFVLGEAISLADAYLFVICTWLEGDQVDINAYLGLSRYFAAMQARPSLAAVKAKGLM